MQNSQFYGTLRDRILASASLCYHNAITEIMYPGIQADKNSSANQNNQHSKSIALPGTQKCKTQPKLTNIRVK